MWNHQKIEELLLEYNNKNVRNISFKTGDINIILGETENKDNKKSSNSLGKSILVDIIDLMYGGKNDKNEITKTLNFSAYAKYEDKNTAKRFYGEKNENFINGKKVNNKDFSQYFNRDSIASGAIIHKRNRTGLYKFNAQGKDIPNYKTFFKALNLDHLYKITEEFYNLKCKIEKLDDLIKEYNGTSQDNIELENEISELEGKISLIEETDESNIKKILEKKYGRMTFIESKRKDLNIELSLIRDKIKKLNSYIERKSKEKEYNIENVLKHLNDVESELIKKKIEDINNFHTQYHLESIARVTNELKILNKKKTEIIDEIDNIDSEIPTIKKIIQDNTELEIIFNEYRSLNEQLQDKKEKYGRSNIKKDLQIKKSKVKTELSLYNEDLYINQNEILSGYEKYSQYSKELVNNLYDGERDTSFKISIKENLDSGQVKYPFNIDFKINGDGGEGINNVKNIIVDLMFFKYNEDIKMQIWDSSCFNGIDPLQIDRLLFEIKEICNTYNKQAIICINYFQLDSSIILKSDNDIVLKLNNKDSLFNIKF